MILSKTFWFSYYWSDWTAKEKIKSGTFIHADTEQSWSTVQSNINAYFAQGSVVLLALPVKERKPLWVHRLLQNQNYHKHQNYSSHDMTVFSRTLPVWSQSLCIPCLCIYAHGLTPVPCWGTACWMQSTELCCFVSLNEELSLEIGSTSHALKSCLTQCPAF